MAKSDLAIKWPDGRSTLKRIKRLDGVPIYGYPGHLKCPGGRVAIVQKDGWIGLEFIAHRIEGPKSVILANGESRSTGYIIRAKKGTIRIPKHSDRKRLAIRWYAVGQLRYYNAKSSRSVLVGNEDDFGSKEYLNEEVGSKLPLKFRPYFKGIPGLPLNNPEAILVNQYVRWIGDDSRFGHNFLRGPRLFTDLFDRRHWRLIEAKAYIDRRTIRTAVGQLLDYKRFFPRRPSLGVLLPEKPSQSCIKFLVDCNITTIWKTPAERFSDSSEGRHWTSRLR
jgi:hypothetical protein